MERVTADLERNGFALVPGVVDAVGRGQLLAELGVPEGPGRRGLLGIPQVAALARSPRLLALVRPHLAREPVPVRALYFDKNPAANWLVPWHQDLTIAVQERVEVPAFGPWSTKAKIPHVQPPVPCLEQMLAVRIHLDPAGAENGALRILPGSHRKGRLTAGQIQALRAEIPEVLCAAMPGDVLLMRPLVLHASARSTGSGHRRILHLEYAGWTLPVGLQWHESA